MFKIHKALKYYLNINAIDITEKIILAILNESVDTQMYYNTDLYNRLHCVYPHQLTNRLPSKNTILKNTLNLCEPTMHNLINDILNSLDTNFVNRKSINQMYLVSAVIDYYHWLANKLSTRGCVSSNEVDDEIKLLKSQYDFV